MRLSCFLLGEKRNFHARFAGWHHPETCGEEALAHIFRYVTNCRNIAIGAAFSKMTAIEKWVRRIMAVAMIVIGIYLILQHNVGMSF